MRVTIRAARVNAGYSQEEAAKKLNVGVKTIQNWEAGATSPRADKMADICALYKCTLDDIIFLPTNCG